MIHCEFEVLVETAISPSTRAPCADSAEAKGHVDDPVAVINMALGTSLNELNRQLSASTTPATPWNTQACVVICDNSTIREANKTFRQKDKVTNVLSFPSGFFDTTILHRDMSEKIKIYEQDSQSSSTEPTPLNEPPCEEVLPLGDILICYEKVLTEAKEQLKDPKAHLSHMACHGLLHLFGYDHIDDAQSSIMEALEIRILNRLGFSSPY